MTEKKTAQAPSFDSAQKISKYQISKLWKAISKGTVRRPKITALILEDQEFENLVEWLLKIGCKFTAMQEWGKRVPAEKTGGLALHAGKKHFIFLRQSETKDDYWFQIILRHELEHVLARLAYNRLTEIQKECVDLYAEGMCVSMEASLVLIFGSLYEAAGGVRE